MKKFLLLWRDHIALEQNQVRAQDAKCPTVHAWFLFCKTRPLSDEVSQHSFLIHAVYRAHYHISWAKQGGIDTFLCSSLTNIFVAETSEVRFSRRFVVVVASALRARLMCTLSHNTRRQGVR